MTQAWHSTETQFRRYLVSSGKSSGTARTYLSNLALFWRWCYVHECAPADADRPAVRAWLSERIAQVSSARAHNDLAALRLFFAWLRDIDYREDDPCAGLRVKRTKTLPTEPLSRGELQTMLAQCGDERDRLIVLLLASTGLRISELAAITAEDIDWPKGIIKVCGKGDKERLLSPHPEVIHRLHAYCGMFPEGPLFLSRKRGNPLSAHQIRKILYDIAARAQVQDIHPHRFRSYFATEYMEQFGDIQALQGVLGHESIQTTARYAEYTRQRRGLEQMRRFNLG